MQETTAGLSHERQQGWGGIRLRASRGRAFTVSLRRVAAAGGLVWLLAACPARASCQAREELAGLPTRQGEGGQKKPTLGAPSCPGGFPFRRTKPTVSASGLRRPPARGPPVHPRLGINFDSRPKQTLRRRGATAAPVPMATAHKGTGSEPVSRADKEADSPTRSLDGNKTATKTKNGVQKSSASNHVIEPQTAHPARRLEAAEKLKTRHGARLRLPFPEGKVECADVAAIGIERQQGHSGKLLKKEK